MTLLHKIFYILSPYNFLLPTIYINVMTSKSMLYVLQSELICSVATAQLLWLQQEEKDFEKWILISLLGEYYYIGKK